MNAVPMPSSQPSVKTWDEATWEEKLELLKRTATEQSAMIDRVGRMLQALSTHGHGQNGEVLTSIHHIQHQIGGAGLGHIPFNLLTREEMDKLNAGNPY